MEKSKLQDMNCPFRNNHRLDCRGRLICRLHEMEPRNAIIWEVIGEQFEMMSKMKISIERKYKELRCLKSIESENETKCRAVKMICSAWSD